MSHSRRDNIKARKKRGHIALEKKLSRSKKITKCILCGTKCRANKLINNLCPICITRGVANETQ